MATANRMVSTNVYTLRGERTDVLWWIRRMACRHCDEQVEGESGQMGNFNTCQ